MPPVPKPLLAPDGSLSPDGAVYLLISLTKRCNMRCPDCYFSLMPGGFFQNQDISLDRGKRIIDFYAGEGVRQAVANAEGEVLLHPHLRDILAHIRSKGLARKPWLATNGILLAPHAEFLLDHTCEILVSVDGPDAASYNAFRGGKHAGFATVVESLQTLVAAKRTRKGGAEIIINYVTTTDRVRQIPAMIDFAETVGADTIKFSNFHATGKTGRAPLRFDVPAVVETIQQVLSRTDYRVTVMLPHIFGDGRLGRIPLGQRQPPFWCKMLLSIVLGANGDFSPCCRIATDAAWGNFDTTPEKHNAAPLRAFRAAVAGAQTHADLPAVCRECNHLSPKRPVFNRNARSWGVSHRLPPPRLSSHPG